MIQLKANQIPQFVGVSGMLSITGTVVRVFEKKSGAGEKGPWSFQTLIIKDETGEAPVVFKNRPEEYKTTDVDKTISVEAQETSHGAHGLKVEQREFKAKDGTPKTIIEAICTKAGKVILDGQEHNYMVNSAVSSLNEAHTAPQQTAPQVITTQKPVASTRDVHALRAESIRISVKAWREEFKAELEDVTNPAYKEIIGAIILASGRNADSLFLSQVRG